MRACLPSVVPGFRWIQGSPERGLSRWGAPAGRPRGGFAGDPKRDSSRLGTQSCPGRLSRPAVGAEGRPWRRVLLATMLWMLSSWQSPAWGQSLPSPSVLPPSMTDALQAESARLLQEGLAAGQQAGTQDQPDAAQEADEDDAQAVRRRPPTRGWSRIERLVAGETQLETGEAPAGLRQFGYEVFQSPVTTFAPVTNVPVGPDYVIGPGDSFTVTLWGRVDARHTVVVDRNGQIALPEVGALRVWGMKFSEMESYLQHELSRKFADFRMSVAMDRLRTIRVFVVGETAAPGTYTISSLSTAIHALFAAGGPSKNGTLRKVRLARNGEEPIQIDLYDFLLGGDRSKDVRLQDGDTIFIPLIGPVVGVAGNVRRPAIYEMAGPTTLSQALDLAGGVTFSGWLQRVQVERVENHARRIVADFDLSGAPDPDGRHAALDTVVRDGDVIKVFPVTGGEQNIVRLEGHVLRPGRYEWKPGMRLRDILPSYSALLPQPHTGHGEIVRLIPPDLHPVVIPFNVGRLLAGDESSDLELDQYDTIRVFRWDQRISHSVSISGLVFDPNTYRLVPDMRVADLIDAAGGLRKNAYLRNAEITRRHPSQQGMTTEKIDIDLEKALAGDPAHNLPLRDYDHIVVRPIPDLVFGENVEVVGEVRFPGRYPIRRGETLSSLIERAGGYTSQAYLKGAVFTRESARTIQRRRLDTLIRELEESMLSSAQERIGGALDAEAARAQQAALETQRTLLTRLRAAEITGRVVVRLTPLEEFRGSKYDLELEDGDILTIPQAPGVVHVVGEVFNSTSLLYEPEGTVSYYLNRVGGMTRDADKKQVSVIKADGSVISMAQGNRGRMLFWDAQHNSWFAGGFMNHPVEPGDTVVVPRRIDQYLRLRTIRDITQIVFQIAVAAGVVLAI
jgi:protein involved in polysaccharide export with SLBB domain